MIDTQQTKLYLLLHNVSRPSWDIVSKVLEDELLIITKQKISCVYVLLDNVRFPGDEIETKGSRGFLGTDRVGSHNFLPSQFTFALNGHLNLR